jgi:chorismate mutase / prephenate dehydratase
MNLENSRNEIDNIDRHIVELLNRRAEIALNIGGIKAKAGIPVFDRRRESEVMRAVLRSSDGTFGGEAMERVFSEILLESRRLQRCVGQLAAARHVENSK